MHNWISYNVPQQLVHTNPRNSHSLKLLHTIYVAMCECCCWRCKLYDFLGFCLFVCLSRSVHGGHMLVYEKLMDRSRLIQTFKSG